MTAHTLIARDPVLVKDGVLDMLRMGMDRLIAQAERDGSGRSLEVAVWRFLLEVGRELYTMLLAHQCLQVTRREAPENPR